MLSKTFLILSLLLINSYCVQQANSEHAVRQFYEKSYIKPIIHAYYTNDFKISTKFTIFRNSFNELYNKHKDYLQVLFTNCDLEHEHRLPICENMRQTGSNIKITGTGPSSQFRQIGNFVIQLIPLTQNINQHEQDQYYYHDLQPLIIGILPNYYKQLNNVLEYKKFLTPKYSPKLVLFIQDQQQIPNVMKQISVAFFLKIDFAVVFASSKDITQKFKIKTLPSFAIVKYNFNKTQHEYNYYTESQLTESNYDKIKQFVGKYALKEQRNDFVINKIHMETNSDIVTIQTQGQLQQYKQKASGWVLIIRSQGPVSPKLFKLHQKYGRYFGYVNYIQQPYGKIQLYSPLQQKIFPLQSQHLQFRSENFQNFKQEMTKFLSKDMLVLGVSADYPHICGLAEKTIFRGNVRCLIIQKQGQKQLQQLLKIDFEVGFIARNYYFQKQPHKRKSKGNKILKDDFEQIYKDLDFGVRTKLKHQTDYYYQHPVLQINQNVPLSQICAIQYKKCLIVLTNLAKPNKILKQTIKQQALNYIRNFVTYQVDIDSNPEVIQTIGGIKQSAQIIVYNSQTQQYIKLNKKITRNLLILFYKANLKNDRRLKNIKSQKLGQIVIKPYRSVLQKTDRNHRSQRQEEEEL